MTFKHFFCIVSGVGAVLLGVAAVVWALFLLKLIPAGFGKDLFFLPAMENLAQTKLAAGTEVVSLNTSVMLIGVSLALSAILSWASHCLRDRVIRYKMDQGEVTVPVHMVERLVLDTVNNYSGLSLAGVRIYKRRGKPNLNLQIEAAYNSSYMDTASSLKKRLTREVESCTGVTLGRVDMRIELVNASPGLGAVETAKAIGVSASESSDSDSLGGMTNQVYEESLADLKEVASTLDDVLDPIDLSLGLSAEPETQDVGCQEVHPGFVQTPYYCAIDVMEKAGIDREYINGWACGYLHNPIREEQCLNEAYETGYEDGMGGDTTNYRSWVNNGESPTSQHIG